MGGNSCNFSIFAELKHIHIFSYLHKCIYIGDGNANAVY